MSDRRDPTEEKLESIERRADREWEPVAAYCDDMWRELHTDVAYWKAEARRAHGVVLECGSGTGRILAAMAGTGASVIGLEPCPAMRRQCHLRMDRLDETTRRRITLVPGRLQSVSTAAVGTVDLAIATWGVFTFVLARPEEALRTLAGCVRSGGRVVLDVERFRHAGQTDGSVPPQRIVTLVDGRRLVRTEHNRYRSADRLWIQDFDYEIRTADGHLDESMRTQRVQRVYTADELEQLVTCAGLTVVERHGDYDRRPLDSNSSRMILHARVGERSS